MAAPRDTAAPRPARAAGAPWTRMRASSCTFGCAISIVASGEQNAGDRLKQDDDHTRRPSILRHHRAPQCGLHPAQIISTCAQVPPHPAFTHHASLLHASNPPLARPPSNPRRPKVAHPRRRLRVRRAMTHVSPPRFTYVVARQRIRAPPRCDVSAPLDIEYPSSA
ncbi:hypothetical protein DFH09DRAFT_1374610 [Mycena vulgaris]|nr:hypothetical protein DFH09DRAFT_1374610 [Mycena vulgaris]